MLDLTNRDRFKSMGDPLEAKNGSGFTNYRTKITAERHVEKDPEMPCRSYDESLSYTSCQEERYIRVVTDVLGCIPPWMSSNRSLWCNHTFNESGKIFSFIHFVSKVNYVCK